MRRYREELAVRSEINVTPLVDVMLVLLIVFMISAPMMVGGIEVELPESKGNTLSGDDEPIIISIQKDGSIYLQEMKVSKADLPSKLEVIAKHKKGTRVFIRGDKNISYGDIMLLFKLVKDSSINNVALITEAD